LVNYSCRDYRAQPGDAAPGWHTLTLEREVTTDLSLQEWLLQCQRSGFVWFGAWIFI
jgi:hypothetical protein